MKYHISYFLSRYLANDTLITDLHSNEFLNAFGCKHGNFFAKDKKQHPCENHRLCIYVYICLLILIMVDVLTSFTVTLIYSLHIHQEHGIQN